MSKFIESLAQFLDQVTEEITRDDLDLAIKMLRERRNVLAAIANQRRTHGPCLSCRQEEIDYIICQPHSRWGDKWLDKLFSRWKTPPHVKVDLDVRFGRVYSQTANGFALSTALGYMCESCRLIFLNTVEEETEQIVEQARRRRRQVAEQSKEDDMAIVRGDKPASIPKRYRTMCNYLTQAEIDDLAQMPYREFLQTIYWDVVRHYKLYKDGFACKLCGKKHGLQVHHRTYEHRGSEYNHLDDLITLCSNCHAKFHDKLPSR